MRIAQIAPLAESVPPQLYGGTERVISTLTEELVRRGHDVTLLASGDSRTAAKLIACSERGLRLDENIKDTIAPHLIQLGEAYRRAGDFDVIHNHLDYLAFPFARLSSTPTVTTTHGRLDLGEVCQVYGQFPDHNLVSISRNQASHLPKANWVGNVYNAIDIDNFQFRDRPGDYLVFLGRISPEKRPDRAMEVARDIGMRLIVAAKVDPADQAYFDAAIKPIIESSPHVEFVGEVDEAGKDQLLGGAYATLFPIDWPEPFGLTMVESMATGTPVIAYRNGSVPEVIVDGVTGVICDSFTGMVEAVESVRRLSRAACRDHVERNFSAATMAAGYEAVYRALAQQADNPVQAAPPAIRSNAPSPVPASV